MHVLSSVWGWWTNSWRRPGLARWLYLAMAAAFAALAIAAGLRGDVAVAVVAGLLVVVTVGLALVVPRLAEATRSNID
jgi:hypothetical protein